MATLKRILSIQSHVVRGCVGNKSATFPLQVLGYEVDAINSVQFSNHTQYPHFSGQILRSEELSDLIDGLRKNDLLSSYSHLMTGYIGDPTFLRETVAVAKELKNQNPKLIYGGCANLILAVACYNDTKMCDPVMGDNGKFYVSESLLPIYQDEVLAVADVVVPNQFEIECLTGVKINSIADAIKAMKVIHDKGPGTVIISSTELGDKNNLVMLASHRKEDGSYEVIKQDVPVIDSRFVGTGDLFAALLLAWLQKSNLKESCSKVISTMQHVLIRTLKAAQEAAGEGNKPTPSQLELHIIQSLRDIENPTIPLPPSEIVPI